MGRASSGKSGGGGDSTEMARRRVESKRKSVGTWFIIATSSWLYIKIALYYLTAILTFVVLCLSCNQCHVYTNIFSIILFQHVVTNLNCINMNKLLLLTVFLGMFFIVKN